MAEPLDDVRAARLSPAEKHVEAAIELADADGDDDFRRARDKLQYAGEVQTWHRHGKRVAAGLKKRKASGKPVGRPPVDLTPADVLREIRAEGSLRAAARALHVHHTTLLRVLCRGGAQTGVSHQPG